MRAIYLAHSDGGRLWLVKPEEWWWCVRGAEKRERNGQESRVESSRVVDSSGVGSGQLRHNLA